MAPYRTGGEAAPVERDGSVVDDLVRQFADPYAFLRELVQNAIDAGATRVIVRMERGERGAARWSVDDDGKGMTLAIIEGPLLTAFSSSKEGDSEAIGKYGVGFLSVFALAPTTVRVLTHRAEGAYEVTLDAAHDFEVSELDPRPGHGTTVVVEHPVPGGDDAAHERRGEEALRRWCRHAERPVELERPGRDGSRRVRIDEPMSLSAPVVVRGAEGEIRAWVGPAAGTERMPDARTAHEGTGPFAGFYNRGLTLFESTDAKHVVSGIRFKVMSRALRHTLSRDAVVHDAELGRAMDLVKRLAARPLRDALEQAVRAGAERASREGDFRAFDGLVAAAWARLERRRIHLPLVSAGGAELVDVETLASADAALLVTADAEGRGRALVARGHRIVRAPADAEERERYANDLAAMTGRSVHFVDELALELEPRDERQLGAAAGDLAAALRETLAEIGLGAAAVRYASFRGPGLHAVSCFVPAREPLPLVALPTDVERFRAHGEDERSIVLDANAAAVVRSIAIADGQPAVAAALLARVVLLEHRGAVPAAAADRLLELAAMGAP